MNDNDRGKYDDFDFTRCGRPACLSHATGKCARQPIHRPAECKNK